MPNLNTLIQDIYKVVRTHKITSSVTYEPHKNKGKLRLSQLGPRCPCELWHMVNRPDLEEEMEPWAYFKFCYGHSIESLALEYAKAAGHTVEGEQDALVLDGIEGHRDCIIDGCIVDVKSASSRSFTKFKDRSLGQNDSFGYLDQLDGYVVASYDDPLVKVKDRGWLLAIDKTLGHMVLYEHVVRPDRIRARIASYKDIVARDTPPPCECGTVPDGKAGNIRLDTKASYSNYKYTCFPGLRCFLYASGPVFLSKVVKRPAEHILEVNRHGQIVHNQS